MEPWTSEQVELVCDTIQLICQILQHGLSFLIAGFALSLVLLILLTLTSLRRN